MSIILKACPFCGFSDYDLLDTLYPDGVTWKYSGDGYYKCYGKSKEFENSCWQVVCGCGAEIHADSKQEAINKWNNRKIFN